jgi:hypothetical protein
MAVAVLLFLTFFIVQSAGAVPGTFNTQKRFLYVQPGQTIFGIVKVLYPEKQADWPEIIKQIVRENPHAFENHEATHIKIGERIKLPSLKSHMLAPNVVVYKGPEAVGQIVQARGKAFAISAKKENRPLAMGSEVYVGDRLFTGADGYLRLSMIDDARIDLRCNSEMLIEDYQLLRAGNRSVIYLLQGSLRKITGSIGKLANDIYEMKTPMATVGVRGTDYALRVLQSHGCDGSMDVNSNGLFVRVNQGAIDLKNQSGVVALTSGNAAHVIGEGNKPQNINASNGVFEKAEKEESSSWWWLLGLIIILAAV